MVSWSPPQFPPDSYNVSYSCQLLCVSELYLSSSDTVNGSVTTHTITSLNAGSNCTVSVTAVYGSNTSNTITSSTNTISAGITFFVIVSCRHAFFSSAPTGAPEGLTHTSVESKSLTLMWETVPCSDQRGPITGYRLNYTYSIGTFTANNTLVLESRLFMMTGLTPFTNYSVQFHVAAINTNGTGPLLL